MTIFCCTSARKGVITVGVICLIAAAILEMINLITCITFEEHIKSCRLNISRDALRAFPSCNLLLDASVLMAARIFIYIQVLIWIFEIIASILLVASAMKKRSDLMIPWIIVSIVVLMILIWNAYHSANSLADSSKNDQKRTNVIDLLFYLFEILAVLVFLAIVRTYSVELSKAPKYCHHVRDITLNHIQGGQASCYECRKPPAVTALLGPPPSVTARLGPPPAYSQFTTSRKGTLPPGLGIHT